MPNTASASEWPFTWAMPQSSRVMVTSAGGGAAAVAPIERTSPTRAGNTFVHIGRSVSHIEPHSDHPWLERYRGNLVDLAGCRIGQRRVRREDIPVGQVLHKESEGPVAVGHI